MGCQVIIKPFLGCQNMIDGKYVTNENVWIKIQVRIIKSLFETY